MNKKKLYIVIFILIVIGIVCMNFILKKDFKSKGEGNVMQSSEKSDVRKSPSFDYDKRTVRLNSGYNRSWNVFFAWRYLY